MRPHIWLIAIGLLAAGGAADAADYRTALIATERLEATTTIGGTVIPYKEVTLSAQLPGQILFVGGGEGDAFNTGSLLLTINDDNLQAQRRAAMAEMQNAEAILRNARVQYSREMWSPSINNAHRSPGMAMPMMFDQMFTRNFGSMAGLGGNTALERYADLSTRASGLNQAQSRLMQSRARTETLDAKLRDARMLAPFDGVIIEKMVEPGDTVQPGQPLMRFAHTKFLRIQAEVPVRLVAGLQEEMLVPARLDTLNADITARVARIHPMADAARHTVTVKFDLPQGVAGGPGMYAEVRIPDTDASARANVVVPKSALLWRGSLPAVFVLTEERISMRLIRLGGPAGKDNISVLAGLRGGEQVILNPPTGMVSGPRHKN